MSLCRCRVQSGRAAIVLTLLFSLVEVHSQTAPYLSFMGETLPNHSYVDLTEVGRPEDSGDSLECHTDLSSCCSGAQGVHRGDWFAPGSNQRLPFSNEDGDIYEQREAQQVDLRRRNNANSPSGIYRCTIPTDAVHNDNDISVRETLYVGMYATSTGGDITISGLTMDSGGSPQFTLTCISTGGPATTVTWTRGSETAVGERMTVFDNTTAATTAQYTHTLTGSTAGVYTCTVANNKPSEDSASITVEGASAPTDLTAVQEGPTSIRVSWTPPSPLGDTTGYRIDYTSSNGSSDSVTVSGGSTDNYLLTGLQNGDTYTISIVATSDLFPSESVTADMTVGLLPDQPVVTVVSTTDASITLSGGVPSDSVAESYEVTWQRNTSLECSDEGSGMATSVGEITGLEEDSRYSITLRAINDAGSSEDTVTAMTLEAAPSAAPDPVTLTGVTSSSITVQWGEVECIDRNGEITDYSVGYSGGGSTQTMPVSGTDATMTTITGLTPSTEYSVQVAAVNDAGTGEFSSSQSRLTLVVAPDLSAGDTTATSISLSWTSAGSEGVSYEVMWQRDTSGECSNGDEDSDTMITDTSYDIAGLQEDSSYSITVRASNTNNSNEDSNTVTAMTLEAVPSAAPDPVTMTGVTSSSITVQWGEVECIHRNGEIVGYSVRYSGGGSTQTMAVSEADATMTTISGLTPSTQYSVQVAAVNGAGTGEYSSSQSRLTLVVAPNVSAGDMTATSISLSWTSAGSEGVSYEVMWQRDTTGECSNGDEDSDTITDTSYDITGLEEDSNYSITVRASNTAGSNEDSNTVTAMTLEADPSAAPDPVATSSDSSSSITVQWGVVPCIHRNGEITGYSVRYTRGGSAQTMAATEREAIIQGLMSSTTYSIEVAAMTGAGTGGYSQPKNQLTQVEAPNVTVTESSVTSTSISLSWTSAGSEGVSYEVEWTYTGGCAGISGGRASAEGMTSYTIEGLEEYIKYSINVNASNAVGSAVSATISGMTSEAIPSDPPTNVRADSTSTTITVQWGEVNCLHRNGEITGYSVQYGEVGSETTETVNVAGDAMMAEVSGLNSSTNYSIAVAAVNGAGTGDYSDPYIIITDSAISVTVRDATTTTSIGIEWTVVDGVVPTGFTVSYSNTDNTDCFTDSNTTTTTDGSARSYDIDGLEEGTEYTIIVSLLRGTSGATDEDTVTQATADARPSAPPTAVSVTGVTSSSITVQWGMVPCIHRNGEITGYSVQYGETQNMRVSGNSSGGVATISGLSPATMYTVVVAAENSAGTGDYSDPVDTLTSVDAPEVTVSSPAAFSVSLSWTIQGTVVDSYQVVWQRNTAVGCPDEHQDNVTITDGSTDYVITGLYGVSDYSITVRASNAAGTAVSGEQVITTAEAAPSAAPANITSSDVFPNSFDIQWGMVPCLHRNGEITGYSVRYGVEGNESSQITMGIRGADNLNTTFSGLLPDTRYVVEVAGENSVRVGDYGLLIVSTPPTVYLNFGGENLPTNGYVSISQLGNTTDTALVCRTDQSGDGGGGWFNPSGAMLEFNTNSSQGFYTSTIEGSDGIYLLRGSGIPVEGIYTCVTTDSSSTNRTVFVGLYNRDGGRVSVSEGIGFTLDSELTATEPQFTLTCISTGGPATTVNWTRNSEEAEGEPDTVLIDSTTAEYNHTLTVTGRLPGVYTCTVSNSIPSNDATENTFSVASAPSDLSAEQTGPDSVRVSWRPPSAVGDTTGYIIYYSSGDSSGSVPVSQPDTAQHELTELMMGSNYSISLVATSPHLPSGTLTLSIPLVVAPGKPVISQGAITGTSITISWTVPSGSVVDSYEVMWDDGRAMVSGDTTSYTIEGLEEGRTYTIAVTAINVAGQTQSDTFTASTTEPEATSNLVAIAGGAGGGGAVAVIIVLILAVILCIVCRSRSSKKLKYNPRNLDGLMYKNSSLPSSVPSDTVEFIKSSEANDSLTVNSIEAETSIYGNLIIPKILQFPESVSVKEREKVVFQVEVTGAPEPTLTWYHDGEEMVSDASRRQAKDGSLTIPSAETKHSGVYQLVAVNPAGTVEREVKLSVEEDSNSSPPPQPQQTTSALSVAFFGNHVETSHSNQNQAFKEQYQGLYSGDDKSTAISINPDNKSKNRFLNICPYDDHRVLLKPLEGHSDCRTDYVNASYVDGYSRPAKFLATQGPLPKTVVDFWRLVWQERAPTVVMITNLVEGTKIKCHQYWPDKDSVKFGPFEVSIIDQQILADYTIRTLIVQLTGSLEPSLRVTHFHFTAWPDHGVPDYATPILAFHRRVITEHQANKGPIMVHCSAGVGRTGTFITIDHALEQVGKENVVDIPGVINKIRNQRMKLVQTVDQYIFIHDAILESVTCGDTQIVSNNLRITIKRLGDKGFSQQFNVLDQVSPRPEEVTSSFAGKNPDRNRSEEFLPADKWRVVLRGDHPDYINAVYINGYKQQRAFIIAQSPMQSTARDFWKMICDRKCGVIVTLCDLVEGGKEVCYQYWPSSGTETHGEFTVELLGEEMMEGYVLKTLSITHAESGNVQQVSQFLITNWAPDSSCDNLSSVSGVVEEMGKVQRRTGNRPITVHCSDTVSRSGMFCAIATTIERCKTEGVVDVFQVVKALRVQKPGAVRNVMQYKTIFYAVLVFLDSFDAYANF